MFDLNHLRQFIAVVEHKTVSKAADALNMTQPALSRSLQNLEYELGVPLFNHEKNKIILNDTGLFLFQKAKVLLEEADIIKAEVHSHYQKNHCIKIGSCAPCPTVSIVENAVKEAFPEMEYSSEVLSEEELSRSLKENIFQIGIFVTKDYCKDFFSLPIYHEKLFAMIPEGSSLALKKEGVYLSEINGETIIPFPLKGYWNTLLEEKLPDSQKLYQTSVEAFSALVQASSLICFTSSARMEPIPNHVAIPVLDKEAQIVYYCTTQKSNRERFSSLFRQFITTCNVGK